MFEFVRSITNRGVRIFIVYLRRGRFNGAESQPRPSLRILLQSGIGVSQDTAFKSSKSKNFVFKIGAFFEFRPEGPYSTSWPCHTYGIIAMSHTFTV